MSSAQYQALPTDDYDGERSPVRHRHIPEHRKLAEDPRFNPPTPSWWKRALVILFIVALFWLSFSLRASMREAAQPKIIHHHRCVHSVCSSYCLYSGVDWSADVSKDTQRTTSTAQRRALSLPRHSRTVGSAYGAQRLPTDLLCKSSYYDHFRDHRQFPRCIGLHGSAMFYFTLRSYSYFLHWDITLGMDLEGCSRMFFETS